jgi:1-acyl-sn-glycerol-3-phosphate acyltransferase
MFLATNAQERDVEFFLVECTNLLGTTYKFEKEAFQKCSVNFCVNHQSMYDIIAMIWFFRRFHCKFVSKELERYSKCFV